MSVQLPLLGILENDSTASNTVAFSDTDSTDEECVYVDDGNGNFFDAARSKISRISDPPFVKLNLYVFPQGTPLPEFVKMITKNTYLYL